MKAIFWIAKIGFFLLALTFAVKNTDPVVVRYYLGMEWQVPLIFALLVVFCLGVASGIVAGLGYMLRLRRENARLRKQTGLSSVVSTVDGPPSQSGAVPSRFPDAV